MQNKICVYAICKNEKQFVNKWINSMSEADYIVVLDTGSTDGTYEMLKADTRVHKVVQQVIDPWRFDTARNESMKLIPDDANILLSTDLDELLEPGWAEVIREKWIDGFHVRGVYRYIRSHTEDGQPGLVFEYAKLHDRNWYWCFPVHEALNSNVYTHEQLKERTLNLLNENVYLHHYPDNTKTSNHYQALLELREKEFPNDLHTKLYLAFSYSAQHMYEKSNKYLLDALNSATGNILQNVEIAYIYFRLGYNHNAMRDQAKAIYYYNKAITQEPSFRDPYLFAAEIYNKKQMYNLAIGYIEEALKKSRKQYSWVDSPESWGSMPEVLLTVAYYYSGQIETALRYAEEAIKKTPRDPQCQFNVDIIKKNLMVQRKL